MAVTANQLIQAMNPGHKIGIPVAAETVIYAGTLVFYERTSGAGEGYALGDDDGGNNNFAGIACAKCDNNDSETGDKTAGDKSVEVFTDGEFVLEGTGFTQAIVGDRAYATDNYTVTADSTSATYIGTFVEYISATKMRVKIDVQTPAPTN